jgi:hypothetical protein
VKRSVARRCARVVSGARIWASRSQCLSLDTCRFLTGSRGAGRDAHGAWLGLRRSLAGAATGSWRLDWWAAGAPGGAPGRERGSEERGRPGGRSKERGASGGVSFPGARTEWRRKVGADEVGPCASESER